jgi:hypothetical protein
MAGGLQHNEGNSAGRLRGTVGTVGSTPGWGDHLLIFQWFRKGRGAVPKTRRKPARECIRSSPRGGGARIQPCTPFVEGIRYVIGDKGHFGRASLARELLYRH